MINVQLSQDDVAFLLAHLERHSQAVENELVHTDVHQMQRELSADLDRLKILRDKISRSTANGSPATRASM